MEYNRVIYESPPVAKHYAKYSAVLQAAERTIIDRLSSRLSHMRMLHIGVGGGRTTPFFAGQVMEYTAIDYSQSMVDVCNKKFSSTFPSAQFLQLDARDLHALQTKHYDFILFSFNGIDYVKSEERNKVFAQIRTVAAPGAYFVFSSHNKLYLPELFKPHFRWHPWKLLRSLLKRKKLLQKNARAIAALSSDKCVEIFDNLHEFDLRVSYVHPSRQVVQLTEAGFSEIELFELTGSKLEKDVFDSCKDPWIYYLCRV